MEYDDGGYAKAWPCVGCGYCCLKFMCYVAVVYAGAVHDRCPYLEFDHGRYWCGLYRRKKVEIYVGAGCTSALNTWRKDVRYRG